MLQSRPFCCAKVLDVCIDIYLELLIKTKNSTMKQIGKTGLVPQQTTVEGYVTERVVASL